MNIAEYTIKKKTVALVFTALIIIGGARCYEKLGRLRDPNFTIKTALVITSYPGASPLEVEEEVTDVLEEAIQQLGQLDEVNSISKEGLSTIYVEIKKEFQSKDLPQIWDELRRKVQAAQAELPPGCLPSFVNDDFGDVYGVFFALTGDGFSYAEIKDHADYLKRELLLVDGVAKVDIWGEQQETVYVEISRARMAEMGVSPQTIFTTLSQQNEVVSAGKVKVGSEYIRITPTGTYQSVEEIGDLVISGYPSDSLIYLKDVATIQRGYIEPQQQIMRFNGRPALGIGVSTVKGGNVVKMGEAVKKRLAEIEKSTPYGMEMGVVSYQSDIVTKSVNQFVMNFLEAILIVIALLVVFMGFQSGFLIGAILILTIAITVIVMYLYGINMQIISIGALVVALGMLVDNAIVVAEGILIKVQQGMDRLSAVKKTVSEVQWPLLGATVIAIMAFSPIGNSPDNVGEFCKSLFQVILISLFASWVLAITLTPLFCFMMYKERKQDEVVDPYAGFLYQTYKRFLQLCLHNRTVTLTAMFVMLIVAVYGFSFVDPTLFPDSDRPQFFVDFWLKEGSHIEETSKKLHEIETYIESLDEVESVAAFIGQGALRFILSYDPEIPNPSYGQLIVNVKDYKKIDSLITTIEEYIFENYPSAEPKVRRFFNGPPLDAKIEARFRGPDPVVLHQLADRAKEIMVSDPVAKYVKDDWRQKVKVIRPLFSQVQSRKTGVSRPDFNQSLQYSFTGMQVGVYREEDELIPIVARAPKEERENVDHLSNVQIWSSMSQKAVPLRQVSSSRDTVWEDPIIQRRDRERTVTAQCDPRVGQANPLFNRLRPQIEAIPLPEGYELLWGGEYDATTEANEGIFYMVPIASLTMFVIVIMLFNALRQPIIIFMCVPLAIIGVTGGLLLTQKPFSFMAMLGFLSLSGMLIKNAIVLIEQIELDVRDGKAPYRAILDASISRLRPVSMAAFTTVLGMSPLYFDPFFASMAVTIMFGLTFATVLTLIVVPVLYSVFFRIHPV